MGSKEENKVQKKLLIKLKKVLSWTALLAFSFNATIFSVFVPETIRAASFPGDTIVGWDFEDVDNIADSGITVNLEKKISGVGTSTNSYFTGNPDKAISATGWNIGDYWQVEFNASDYKNLKLSSMHRSSDTGPKDFQIEYSLDETSWTAVSGGVIAVTPGSTWNTTISNLALPSAVDFQSSIYLRWVVTSNVSASGETLVSSGTNRIDNIIVTGVPNQIPTAPNLLFPEDGTFLNNSTPRFGWESSVDPDGDTLVYSFEVGNSDFSTIYATGSTPESEYQMLVSLSDYTYYWRVKTIDQHDNDSEWSSVRSFTIDTIGPKGTHSSAVNATNPTNNNNPEVYGKFYDNELSTASEAINYEVKKIEVVFDNGSEKYVKEAVVNRDTDTYSTKNSADFSVLVLPTVTKVLPDGTYKVSAFAYDEAGNWTEEVIEDSLVIDTKAPETPQNLQVIQKTPTSITLKWDKSVSQDTKGYLVYYGTQSGVYASSLDVGNVLEYTISGLKPQTTYYFAVKAYDSAMNFDKLSVEVSEITPQEVRVASVISDQTEDGQVESVQDEKVGEVQDENKEESKEESEKNSGFWWFIIISLAIVGAYWFWSRNPGWHKKFLRGKNPRIG